VTRLGVIGASGKMGRAVLRLALDAGLEVVAAIGADNEGVDAGTVAGRAAIGVILTSDLSELLRCRPDVAIDFSSANAFASVCVAAAAADVPLVSGTTGLGELEFAALARAATEIPVLWEPNMSVGIHVLSQLLEYATWWLGSGFDVEISETHHRFKVDAPSGTALRLLETVKRARAGGTAVHGRSGDTGTRGVSEIGMHAVRGGDVIGDHTVMFLGEGERIELSHRATHRDLFARGAIRAALWLSDKQATRRPARYRFVDMLPGLGAESLESFRSGRPSIP
jgi:4-hydroxy-tetrahydrodipicolinate reductase